MLLSQILDIHADHALLIQRNNGCFPAGHNGPWMNEETPARTTAHWAVLLYWAYKKHKKEKFYIAFEKACNYLLSMRPYGKTFFCIKRGARKENGLIGQVWCLQPFFGGLKDNVAYSRVIRTVIRIHGYDRHLHLWRNSDLKGKIREINWTLNQQIWFGTIALKASLFVDKELERIVKDFFMNLATYIKLYIYTRIAIPSQRLHIRDFRSFIRLVEEITDPVNFMRRFVIERTSPVERDIGYFPFTIWGLSVASKIAREYDIQWWDKTGLDEILQKMIHIATSEQFLLLSYKSRFAWGYNPIGFELAQSLININMHGEMIKNLVKRQFLRHLDDQFLLRKNTCDPNTLMSRIYEAIDLPNIELEVK